MPAMAINLLVCEPAKVNIAQVYLICTAGAVQCNDYYLGGGEEGGILNYHITLLLPAGSLFNGAGFSSDYCNMFLPC